MNKTLKPGWSYKKLNELGFVGRGKSKHRPRNEPSLYGGKHPFIQTAEVTASEFYIIKYSQTYSDLGLAQSKLWDKNTLCIVNAGENTAETAILKFQACFPDSIIGFIADSEKADVRFIKYYLTTIKPQLRSITKGATQDNLSVSKLLLFDILTPPLPIQRKIAGILSAYDRLIENNTRRIEILEEMARSIYREWFVKFRFPGHEQAQMVDSELGLIPEGWEVGRLDDALILQRGFDLPTQQRKEGNIPIYASTGITGTHNEAKIKAPGVVTGRSGSLGTVIYVDEDYWPLNTTLWVKEFRRVTPLYAFYLLSDLKLEQYNSGAAVPTLNRNDIHGQPVVLPPQRILEQLNLFVEPLLVLKKNLLKRSDNLRQTRDLVLPRLISGKIDLEKINIGVYNAENN
ncbi:restriction endonuclease subunit S [Microcoleus sp. herbarium12]|uniref:restriction endonuclease subunit S n=1 Tax=Microcoleus sp. herbarium12 TaxID=3055437 RepID=UPI002FD35466